MQYPRKQWYSSQDETFQLGCLIVIPSSCLLFFALTQALPLSKAFLFGLPLFLLDFYVDITQDHNNLKRESLTTE